MTLKKHICHSEHRVQRQEATQMVQFTSKHVDSCDIN